MAGLDRRTGFKLMQLGFWLILIALCALLWPKYGQKFADLFLPERMRSDHQEKAAKSPEPQAKPQPEPSPEPKSWDPSKETLPPGMAPAKRSK
jgi:hypothetical protein